MKGLKWDGIEHMGNSDDFLIRGYTNGCFRADGKKPESRDK